VAAYSPERRTAVVLSGTGIHGAYHAGVLRALQEAGVKVDLLAGHGAGAANAALGAIDGQALTWEPGGLWVRPGARDFYSWTPPVLTLSRLVALLAALLLLPLLVVVATALVVYPLGFVLDTVGPGTGTAIVASYQAMLQRAFAPGMVPAVVPRLGVIVIVAAAGALLTVATRARWRARPRTSLGAPWWSVLGAPVDASAIKRTLAGVLSQLLKGAGTAGEPDATGLGGRYGEVLNESLGQPGFRELIVAVSDLDTRRDVIGALLREPYSNDFLAARPARDRDADILDLSGPARGHIVDLVTAGLTPPVLTEPHAIQFAADGHWRGETHRVCDRPGIIHRLLEEVAAAGVTQVVIVSACATSSDPHQLRVTPLDIRHRLGEFVAAAEAAALRDAAETARLRFDAVYVIRPAHNALGPFDCAGAYDRTSERHVGVAELVRQGHDDASRQFIEPVVGASGERLARPAVPSLLAGAGAGRAATENGAHPSVATIADPVARRRAQVERLFGDE
jgi:hypothetical protein